jgi:signal transduction histidine kinase
MNSPEELKTKLAQEIEARKRAEEELEQFVHAASHDLRAPLRALDNLSQWIEEDLGKSPSAELASHLALMHQRIRRMSRLLEDLLEYSRAGREEQALQNVDLKELCGEVLKLLPPRPGIRFEIAAGMPNFQASLKPLARLLFHLLSNAFKHHDKEQGLVTVSAKDLGAAVEIEVKDDGPGIEPRHQERVFQPFQTLRSRDEVEGSGLGLAIVSRMLQRRSGKISLDSEPGKGSVFRVSWPKGS